MSDEEKKYGRGENPVILKNLKPFGSEGGSPQSQIAGGNKPWSIRNSIRHLARQEIDQTAGKDAFKNILPPKPTVAQLIAANALAKATKADMRAVEYVTDQIDGKLAQTNINADLAAIQGMSDDELREFVDGVDNRGAEAIRSEGVGETGDPQAGGRPGDAPDESESSGPAGDSGGIPVPLSESPV